MIRLNTWGFRTVIFGTMSAFLGVFVLLVSIAVDTATVVNIGVWTVFGSFLIALIGVLLMAASTPSPCEVREELRHSLWVYKDLLDRAGPQDENQQWAVEEIVRLSLPDADLPPNPKRNRRSVAWERLTWIFRRSYDRTI